MQRGIPKLIACSLSIAILIEAGCSPARVPNCQPCGAAELCPAEFSCIAGRCEDKEQIGSCAADDAAIDALACLTTPLTLRARWKGEDNAVDVTGQYNGSAVGGLAYTAGRDGKAFAFNGTDSAIKADPTDQLWPPASYSVEVWLKTSTLPAQFATLISKYDCGGAATPCGPSQWSLTLTNAGHPLFTSQAAVGLPQSITASTTPVVDGAWHHLVGVRDVAAMKVLVYVDGQFALSSPLQANELGASTNADGQSDPVVIGAGRRANDETLLYHYVGALDELAFYNSALSASDIARIYAAGFCP